MFGPVVLAYPVYCSWMSIITPLINLVQDSESDILMSCYADLKDMFAALNYIYKTGLN